MNSKLRSVPVSPTDYANFMQIVNQAKSMNHRIDTLERIIVNAAYIIIDKRMCDYTALGELVAEATRIEAAQRVTPKRNGGGR